ncbi:M56 family metallopeptidase [Paludisphaera mucosa]|uniref:M56 family metallopeptidase n=1 Tax=Paludisphaera mucosa TaxID=3030827 RepID=A0ABT6FAG2_9BACT|nr:M56 family metallopeptidase [Paludisphaera mucosa]MDG3004575.1 M56 family metallopeptidase [Paludisphaera mucosa]
MEDLMGTALTNALGAAVLGTIVAGLSLILVRRPAVVHCLWVVVLLKLVTPPLFEVSVGPFETEAPAREVAAPVADFEPAVVRFEMEWPPAETFAAAELAPEPIVAAAARPVAWSFDPALAWRIFGAAWLAGALATAALAAVRVLRFQRRLREASPAGWLIEDEVARLAAEMGLRRPPLVDFIDARTTPMIWGLGLRPRLILPRMLWKELDGRSRTLLLAHELAHLKRGDHLLRFFELAVTVLYWWLPVVWWVRRALRDVEEQCCDAWVVWMFPDDARAYAETLLDTVDFLNPNADPEPLLASGFGKVQHLRRRLTMVMKGTTPRTLGWRGSLGALALAGVLLPMSPTWARKTEAAAVTFVAAGDDEIVRVGQKVDGEGPAVTFRAVADGQDGEILTFNVIGQDVEAAVEAAVAGVETTVETTVAEIETAVESAVEAAEASIDQLVEEQDGVKEADKEKQQADKEKAKEDQEKVKADKEKAKEDQEKVKADKEKAKEDQEKIKEEVKKTKDELRKQIRIQIKADGAEAGEAMKKAAEQLRSQIKELQDKKPEGEMGEVQIKALKGALDQIERMARDPKRLSVQARPAIERRVGQTFTFSGDPLKGDFKFEPKVALGLRIDSDDPKAVEARKQVEELSKVMAEKQKEMAEVGKKLAEAHQKLAELQGHVVVQGVRPDVARVKELRSINVQPFQHRGPGSTPDSKDKARIDSLEQKLDKVLHELESLKKPHAEADEKK